MKPGGVTIVVPVWNRRDLLEPLFARLREQTWPVEEILVVDDGSADGSAEAAEAAGARVIRMGVNTGFTRAVNRGIREARSEFVAILNNDVEPAPDWLERLMKVVSERGIWYAVGKLLSASSPERIDGTYDLVCRGGCAWRTGAGRPDGPVFSLPRSIFLPPWTAAVFRAELFRRIGLLDERFESYLEDVDFGLRCVSADLSGCYVPEALAWHRGSATLGRWHTATVRHIARNQVYLVAKHYPGEVLLRNLWPILVAQGLWSFVALRHGQGWSWLRGKFAGLAAFYRIRRSSTIPQANRIAPVLEAADREIRILQEKTGFDSYWRVYFFLTRSGAK